MNVQPGDLAVIVHSDTGNGGKLVTVLRSAFPEEVNGFDHRTEGHHWWVRAEGRSIVTRRGLLLQHTALPDCRLRAIRPQADEAQDQVFAALPASPLEVTP